MLFGKFSVCILVKLDICGKREKNFFIKRENKIWKRWRLGLRYFNPLLPLYRTCPINLLHKSVDWFLYNGNIGLNGKVKTW